MSLNDKLGKWSGEPDRNLPVKMKTATHYLGIDVSKATLDCALQEASQKEPYAHWKLGNNASGFKDILKRLRSKQIEFGQVHVVFESTASYGEALHEAMHKAGLLVSCVNPRMVKHFKLSLNKQTKTDKIDAATLARYGVERKPVAHRPASPTLKRLRAWIGELDALVENRLRLLNRMENTSDQIVLKHQKATLRSLEASIEAVDRSITSLIDGDPILARHSELLQTIPGIGARTASRVLAYIEDKDFESARSLAAYAGLTPTTHQSGTSVHKRPHLSKTGNAALRRALYMPAATTKRCCLQISRWADSLLSRGKSKMAVRAAVMRKLLHIIFGVLKHETPFDPSKAALSTT
jgi:transposase